MMARDVGIYQSCGYIDEALDAAKSMVSGAANASESIGDSVDFIKSLIGEMPAIDRSDYLEMETALGDIRGCVLDLDRLGGGMDDVEYNLETTREINSELRSTAECYGNEADTFEDQVRRLQDFLNAKEDEIVRLENTVNKLEEIVHGQNIRQPGWQPG